MPIEQFQLDGLGHLSYLVVDDASGAAAVVDPRRDVAIYLAAAARHGAHITHILETHLHNDYVSGARELAARTGAAIVIGAGAQAAYPHLPARDGERFPVGELTFEVLATPGHTPEHVSYALRAAHAPHPHAVFTGGSMLVGGAGRTDLLPSESTLALTHQQYHSLRRLLDTLPDTTLVYPTHGAGSFCTAGGGGLDLASTIAQERVASPAAQSSDEDDFTRRQMASFTAYPSYYAHMRAINQRGPRILGELPVPAALAPRAVHTRQHKGTALVDSRRRDAFAREHVPGSLNIELDASFGTYAGWILPFNAPLMLVVEDEAGQAEAVVQLIRIGYERIAGTLRGGVAAWQADGYPVAAFERIDIDQLYARWQGADPPAIVDVRREDEWRGGHIPGARHISVADLPQRADEVPRDRPVAVICASGYRAAIGASILAATGHTVTAVQGGVPDWLLMRHPIVSGGDDAPTSPGGQAGDATHAHP
jgi:hydroxyacylglutathione hydrolase